MIHWLRRFSCCWLGMLLAGFVAAQQAGPTELGGLRVPPPASTVVDTNATFAIGLTADAGISWRQSAGPQDLLRIVGRVRPEAAQVGQAADVFMVVRTGAGFLMRTVTGAFVPWSGQVADLQPFRQQVVLTADTSIDLYEGRLGTSGDFQLFLGYRATDGLLHYSARSFALSVSAASAIGTGSAVTWMFDGTSWRSSGTPPACPSPLLQTPVDLSKVTSILYPGQVRGGNYKAHGGFRFDGPGQTNQVPVMAAFSGTVYRGVRYIESGVTQYLFDIINPCGLMMRFDHLLELSPKFAAIANTLPLPTDTTQTTQLSGYSVSVGETIATAVGMNSNVSVDFGVYDLRTRNAGGGQQSGELGPYGICWLDALPAADSQRVRSLPAGDGAMGKTSDYCR